MTGKVAVLGQIDFVMPFSAMGLEVFVVSSDRQQVLIAARQIASGRYALIVVAEDVANIAMEVFEDLQRGPIPCIVVVPFTTGSTGFATRALAEVLKTTTGNSIIGNGKV